jgi:hypothetical protein
MIVTAPSGEMRIKALSAAALPAWLASSASAGRITGGSTACSSSPPPTAALALRKMRRDGEKSTLGAARFAKNVAMAVTPPRPSAGSPPF